MKDYNAETEIFETLKNSLATAKSTMTKVEMAIKAIEGVIDSREGWKKKELKGLNGLYTKLCTSKSLYDQVRSLAVGEGTGWGTLWTRDLRSIFKKELNNINNDITQKPVRTRETTNEQSINDTCICLNKLLEDYKDVLDDSDKKIISESLLYVQGLNNQFGDISSLLHTVKTKVEKRAKLKKVLEQIRQKTNTRLCSLGKVNDQMKQTINSLQQSSLSLEDMAKIENDYFTYLNKQINDINKKLNPTKEKLLKVLKTMNDKYTFSASWKTDYSNFASEINSAVSEDELKQIETKIKTNDKTTKYEAEELKGYKNIIIKKIDQKVRALKLGKDEGCELKEKMKKAKSEITNASDKQKVSEAFNKFEKCFEDENKDLPKNIEDAINKINAEYENSEKQIKEKVSNIKNELINKCKELKTNSELKCVVNKWDNSMNEAKITFEYSQENISIINKDISKLEQEILLNKKELIEKAELYKNIMPQLSNKEQLESKRKEWKIFIDEIVNKENNEKNKNQGEYLKKQLENIKKPLKNLYEFKGNHKETFKDDVVKQLLNGLNLLSRYDDGLSSLIKDSNNEKLLSNKDELGKIMKSGKIKSMTMNYLYFISDILDAVDNYANFAVLNEQDDTNKSSTIKKGNDKDFITENYLEEELHCKNKFNEKLKTVQRNNNYSEVISKMSKIVDGKFTNTWELYQPLVTALDILLKEYHSIFVEDKNANGYKTNDQALSKVTDDFVKLKFELKDEIIHNTNLTKRVNDYLHRLKSSLTAVECRGVCLSNDESKSFREVLVEYIDYLLNSQNTGMPMWGTKNGNPEIKLSDIKQQNYKETHYVGDCWLMAALKSIVNSKPNLILDCFPKWKNEINKDGKIIGDTITVRLFEVLLSAHIKDEYSIRIYCRPIKPVELELNTKLGNVGNISGVAWPNFIEKAMAIYRNKHLVKTGGNACAEFENRGTGDYHYQYGKTSLTPKLYLNRIIQSWEKPQMDDLEFGNEIGVGKLNGFPESCGLTYSILTGHNGGQKKTEITWSNDDYYSYDESKNEIEVDNIVKFFKHHPKSKTSFNISFKQNFKAKRGKQICGEDGNRITYSLIKFNPKEEIFVLKVPDEDIVIFVTRDMLIKHMLDLTYPIDYIDEKERNTMSYDMLLKRRMKNPTMSATITFKGDFIMEQCEKKIYLFGNHAYSVKEITEDYIIVLEPRHEQEIKISKEDVINNLRHIEFGKVE